MIRLIGPINIIKKKDGTIKCMRTEEDRNGKDKWLCKKCEDFELICDEGERNHEYLIFCACE